MSASRQRARQSPTPRPRRDDGALAWIARVGYVARGLVFLIIAFFAGLAVLGSGRSVGTRGALHTVLGHPMGSFLLWIIAFGLLCFAVWRLVEAIFDVDEYGRGVGGLVRRAGLTGGAV